MNRVTKLRRLYVILRRGEHRGAEAAVRYAKRYGIRPRFVGISSVHD